MKKTGSALFALLFLFSLLFGCGRESMLSDAEIVSAIRAEEELQSLGSFASSQQLMLEKKIMSAEEIKTQQQLPGGMGEWFRKVSPKSYISVTATNENKTQFLFLIDPDTKEIVHMLGIITVQLT